LSSSVHSDTAPSQSAVARVLPSGDISQPCIGRLPPICELALCSRAASPTTSRRSSAAAAPPSSRLLRCVRSRSAARTAAKEHARLQQWHTASNLANVSPSQRAVRACYNGPNGLLCPLRNRLYRSEVRITEVRCNELLMHSFDCAATVLSVVVHEGGHLGGFRAHFEGIEGINSLEVTGVLKQPNFHRTTRRWTPAMHHHQAAQTLAQQQQTLVPADVEM
jgi:hypothetical protein